ncbi:hypothetical protein PFISCL1PPCAC_2134, partial [Pristionchus fissidentatus]
QFLFSLLLPSMALAEIVYARTSRLDQAEFDNWNKTCGMQMAGKQTPFKVMVYVSKLGGDTMKCVGVILNKRFVLTSATCYYNREKNNYGNDEDMRTATKPQNTKVVICDDDGINCDQGRNLKEIVIVKVIYPQIVQYSKAYENVADIALLETGEELPEERQICTPDQDERFRGQRVFLISHLISGKPFIDGDFEWKGERTCGEVTVCAETLTFKPSVPQSEMPMSGIFYAKKNDRMFLLGMLKYENQSKIPKIISIFPLFHDFVCSNTGDCGSGYDKYMFMRETRTVVNGLPLPQVSHCDVVFTDCKEDPIFFRYLPKTEMEELQERCGKAIPSEKNTKKTKWHTFPHMAAIIGKGRVCSAVFISQVHVITTSHCLFVYEGEDKMDEYFSIRDKDAGKYIDPSYFKVHYGAQCYADGNTLNLDYKYQVVLLELEQPTSKDVVVPICIHPGVFKRGTAFEASSGDFFHYTSAGNPEAENSFVTAKGNKIPATNCDEYRTEGRIRDFNCRDDNVDFPIFGKSDARGFSKNNVAFLGSQLSYYNGTTKRRYLYGLAHYRTPGGGDGVLGAFYPIWSNERYICWFTGVCHFGRPENHENRFFKIYTTEYRLTRSVYDAPVQRAGKTNLSNYEIVMLEENDTKW